MSIIICPKCKRKTNSVFVDRIHKLEESLGCLLTFNEKNNTWEAGCKKPEGQFEKYVFSKYYGKIHKTKTREEHLKELKEEDLGD